MRTVGILVASDQGSKGLRVDESGALIKQMVEEKGYQVVYEVMVSDDIEVLREAMLHMADALKCHLILTTGGTGFSMHH